jgi:hypothetical protein
MMRSVLLGLACSACFVVSAWAADDDVMAGFYGNTAVSVGGMAETHTTYTPDHNFIMKAPAFGAEFKGTWAVNGKQLCRTFESPPPGVTNPLCTPIEAHKVGDTWKVGVGSEMRTVTLVKGMQ